MKTIKIKNNIVASLTGAVLVMSMLMVSFFAFEPVVSFGQTTDVFIVNQEITGEISFSTPANDVTMVGPIAGITGGTSNGNTNVVVTTNNATGYGMTIAFSDDIAMNHNTIGGAHIPNYVPAVAGTADYTFNLPANSSRFGYTVASSTNAADVVQRFRDNGTTCNIGANVSVGNCWYNTENAAATPVPLINRSTATPAEGSATNIGFRVGVGANPSPALPTGIYTATATLTITTN